MNSALLISYFPAVFTVLMASKVIPITTSTTDQMLPPSSPQPGGCADAVISFSPCLPYISAPPNDLSDKPTPQCCDLYNSTFHSGEAECLCYLVRRNTLLGFPLNASKLLSLSNLCSVKTKSQRSNANDTSASLESVCAGSPTLPPLLSSTNMPHSGPGIPKVNDSGSSAPPPPPPPPTKTPLSSNSSSTTSQQSNDGSHLAPPTVFPHHWLFHLLLHIIMDF